MKNYILFALLMLGFIMAQAQTAATPVTAEVVSARVYNERSERHYNVTVKLKCPGHNSLRNGDTITFLGTGNGDQYKNIVCKRIVGNNFSFIDSTYTFTFLGYVEDDNTFTEVVNLIEDIPYAGRRVAHDTVKANSMNYIVEISLKDYIPLLNIDKFTKLVMDRYPISGQASFSYYSKYETTLRWVITDWNGRRVGHGFMQVKIGRNSYSLSIDGMGKGRYSLMVGEGTEQEEDTFTVL